MIVHKRARVGAAVPLRADGGPLALAVGAGPPRLRALLPVEHLERVPGAPPDIAKQYVASTYMPCMPCLD